MRNWKYLLGFLLIVCAARAADPSNRERLVEAITTEDGARQAELLRGFAEANEPVVKQVLEAWRGGLVYILEQEEKKIPVLLDAQTDGDGRAAATRIIDGSVVKEESGATQMFSAIDLTPADASSKLRR